MRLPVSLNGTATNPFIRFGLTINPFPSIALAAYDFGLTANPLAAYDAGVRQLGAEPIPPERAEAYIRETLAGFSAEFVDLCISQYRPGEYVTFGVTFPE
jgi:hypothetical protein